MVTLRATVEGEDGIERRKFSGALGAEFHRLHGIGIFPYISRKFMVDIPYMEHMGIFFGAKFYFCCFLFCC